MSRKTRKNYTPKEKVSILKRHLVEKVAVSDLCDQHNLRPTVFYRWLKEFFENGAAAFAHENKRSEKVQQKKISRLEERLQQKDEVLAELMYEHVQLKKSLGEL
jgi:transposase-like protein